MSSSDDSLDFGQVDLVAEVPAAARLCWQVVKGPGDRASGVDEMVETERRPRDYVRPRLLPSVQAGSESETSRA